MEVIETKSTRKKYQLDEVDFIIEGTFLDQMITLFKNNNYKIEIETSEDSERIMLIARPEPTKDNKYPAGKFFSFDANQIDFI